MTTTLKDYKLAKQKLELTILGIIRNFELTYEVNVEDVELFGSRSFGTNDVETHHVRLRVKVDI